MVGSTFRLLLVFVAFAFFAVAGRAQEAPRLVYDYRSLMAALPGTEGERLPGGFTLAIPAANVPAKEPRFGWDFTRVAYVYAPRREPRGMLMALSVRVHFSPEDETQALRTARLCARLLRLHREKFGHEAVYPRAAEIADVWLATQSAADPTTGGETWNSNVYIYAVRRERTPIEWVRTVAHEWGHLTLPAARGFTAPENDAAGYLGERLHIKWMRSETRDTAIADGTTPTILDFYYDRQIAPLIARFQEGGPDSPLLSGNDAESMDYYIGMALAFDEAFGSLVTGRAIFSIDGLASGDLLAAMQDTVSRMDSLTIRLPAWMPLSKTTYAVTGDAAGSVAIASRPPLIVRPVGPASLPVRLPGWKPLRAADGAVRSVTLRRTLVTGEENR